ncbi:MAG: DNA internalization-related competence protein ComEC/Rec2 [Selenomonadaceae bacterium]|nr:DNA internalization-related competence protein ComEC/Rec2 [Selenomonadaceae bacterium]
MNSLLASTAAGIFCASNLPLQTRPLMIASVIAFVVAALTVVRNRRESFVACSIMFMIVGAMRFQAVDTLPPDDISTFANQRIAVNGRIVDAPDYTLIDHNLYIARFNVEVDSVKTLNGIEHASGRVRLTARMSEPPDARIDDRISAIGKLSLPINYNNPGQIDSTNLLKTDGITARMSVTKSAINFEPVDGSLATKFLRAMAAVRQHYKDMLDSAMPSDDAAAIFAMLFGGYGGLRAELIESFTTVGIVHILSVSGSHISILAAAAGALASLLKLRRASKFMIGCAIIVSYAILSGCVPPVIRSAATGCLTFFALAFNRQRDARRLLTIVALIMLLFNPLLLFHISFQLSFTATAGILFLSPLINRRLEKLNPNDHKLISAISMSIACTLGATILPQPVVAWYFNQLSISSLLANLIVTPILEVIIVAGLAAGLIAFVVPPLAKFICVLLSLAFGAAYELTSLLAKLPRSSIYFPTLQPIAAVAYYAFIALIVRRSTLIKYFLIAALIAVPIGFVLDRDEGMRVHFIDVHQGDCALVITPHGRAMMFDTGGVREHNYDLGGRVVVPYLKHFGVTHLDYIFLSHSDADHCEAVGSLLDKMPVDHIITSHEPRERYADSFGMSEGDRRLDVMRAAVENETFEVDGVKVKVIYSPKDIVGGANEFSNVYRVTYGAASFLITGDLTVEGEHAIIDRDIGSTVLKVGHHGSLTSSSEEFIRAVAPKYTVICVGANNTFGHPRHEIVERLERSGATIKRTDIDGAIVFTTDGNNLRVSTCR